MNSDPVIAALHRQQRLYDAFVSAIDTRKGAAAANAYNTAFDELLKTRPKTRAGAAALISTIAWPRTPAFQPRPKAVRR